MLLAKISPSASNIESAFRNAAYNGYAIMVSFLIGFKKLTAKDFESTLIQVVANGHVDVVSLLNVAGHIDPTFSDNYAIKQSAYNGYFDMITYLLTHRAAHLDTNYALSMAARNGHPKIVQLLLKDWRTNPAADDSYALRVAAFYGHTDIVKLLIDDGRSNPSAQADQALRGAITHGFVAIAKLLTAFVNPAFSKQSLDATNRVVLHKLDCIVNSSLVETVL